MELKKAVRLSMFLSLAIVLNILESFIPLFNGVIPGLRLGLANIVTLIVLYIYTFKDVIYISFLRVVLVSILRTGLFNFPFFFSLGGVTLSVMMMFLSKKITKLSIVGVSIIGSLSHSIGQVIMAIILIKNINMIYYLPYLLIFSIPTGILTGIISKELVKYLKNS